jgi:hypothetical protein
MRREVPLRGDSDAPAGVQLADVQRALMSLRRQGALQVKRAWARRRFTGCATTSRGRLGDVMSDDKTTPTEHESNVLALMLTELGELCPALLDAAHVDKARDIVRGYLAGLRAELARDPAFALAAAERLLAALGVEEVAVGVGRNHMVAPVSGGLLAARRRVAMADRDPSLHALQHTIGLDDSERRAPVQANRQLGKPAGTIAWSEHLEAYADYAKRYGTDQSAERLAERGGFCYGELVEHLGREPSTWEPR